MIFVRKRLFFWLVKAYIRRWGKRILFFFFLGFLLFFLLLQGSKAFITRFPVGEKETIGVKGDYKVDTLPPFVLSDLSMGLTTLASSGEPQPGIAASWKIEDSGKKYTFFLKKNVYFSDGDKLTSADINYPFKDAAVSKPSDYTIVFTLKESYGPFLISVSRPVFKKGFVGVGDYTVKQVQLNGEFVKSFTIASTKNAYKLKVYRFYPTEEALKIAFLSGEVSKAHSLSDVNYKQTSFYSHINTRVEKKTDYARLVTVFFTTTDSTLSDTKIRNALAYAIPEKFPYGERSYSPLPPTSWAYATGNEKLYDPEHAKLLLSSSSASNSASLTITLKTLPRYKQVASDIVEAWDAIGVKTTVEVVESIPASFQAFIGDFTVPRDPDQYALWHSNQENNLTHYNNLRIDKLLEDGRKITNYTERVKIYADFQKYLLADSPAIFLYFPYSFDVIRK